MALTAVSIHSRLVRILRQIDVSRCNTTGHMAQITLRLPDDLLEEIDQNCGPETSRSEWLRQSARARLPDRELTPDTMLQKLDRMLEELDELETRIDRLEEQREQSLITQLFK